MGTEGVGNGVDVCIDTGGAEVSIGQPAVFRNEFIAQGDRVVVLGSFSARSKTTDKQYTTDFAHIITVKEGKITSFYEFFDNAAAGRAHTAAQTA